MGGVAEARVEELGSDWAVAFSKPGTLIRFLSSSRRSDHPIAPRQHAEAVTHHSKPTQRKLKLRD
jgi:hypothetical protein